MKEFLNDLLTLLLSMISIICLYFAIMVSFSSALYNFLLLFFAIFLIIQIADIIDKNNNFGKYQKKNKK